MTTTTSQSRPEFDDLLDIAPANDVYRCSPDDPFAGMVLVKQIAASVARRLPSYIERDELVSLGAMGWAEARVRFDPTRGVPFAGFAAMRIRGAILDGLRAGDTLTRGERRRARLEATPTSARIISASDELEAAAAPQDGDVSDLLAQEEMLEELRAALATLPERERFILQRHFFDDVPMRAVGAELGVTESRISQIVTAAVSRLRTRFGIAVLPAKAKRAKAPASTTRTVATVAVAVAA